MKQAVMFINGEK